MEPFWCRRSVEHCHAVPVELLGQVVDLGAGAFALEAGDPQLEEAGEDQVAFVVGEFHDQIDDYLSTASYPRDTIAP
jgi:hypothetical protein